MAVEFRIVPEPGVIQWRRSTAQVQYKDGTPTGLIGASIDITKERGMVVAAEAALTRLGEDSHMVVTGDPSQSDLPGGVALGLQEALSILEGVEGVGVARFEEKDVVRHPLVARIVAAYSRLGKS